MHKEDNSRKSFKGALTRALAVILCVSMVFGVLGLTGCSLIDDLTNGVAQKSLSEAELARLVTNAVISDAKTFASIAFATETVRMFLGRKDSNIFYMLFFACFLELGVAAEVFLVWECRSTHENLSGFCNLRDYSGLSS